MDKKTALYLLEEAFAEADPALVHGTSVEAVIQLLSNGKLPSARGDRSLPDDPINKGYLFFVPRRKSFENHPLYNWIKVDLDGNKLEDEVKNYAAFLQQEDYLNKLFGSWPTGVSPLNLFGSLREFGELITEGVDVAKIRKYGAERLERELNRRKGVVIGINNQIFELDIESDLESDGDEVMIHLPDGLNIKYVQYIYPFGRLESKALDIFVGTLP